MIKLALPLQQWIWLGLKRRKSEVAHRTFWIVVGRCCPQRFVGSIAVGKKTLLLWLCQTSEQVQHITLAHIVHIYQ